MYDDMMVIIRISIKVSNQAIAAEVWNSAVVRYSIVGKLPIIVRVEGALGTGHIESLLLQHCG